MTYDAAAVRRLGIDPTSWQWFNKNYDRYRVVDPDPNATTLVIKESTRLRTGWFITFLLASGLYLVACLVFPFSLTGHMLGSLIGPVFLLLTGIFIQGKSTGIKVAGCLMLALIVGSAYIVLSETPEAAGLGAMTLGMQFLASLCLGRIFRRSTFRYGTYVEVPVPVQVDGASLWSNPNYRVFGTPGKVASAADKFGQDAVDAGVKGEENTAALLDLLLKIPGTTVYHGLRFPDSKNADVDHAVAHGSTVFLIDSKLYRWGEYEWQCTDNGSDKIVRTDGYGRGYKNSMDAAAEGYRRIMGPGVNVVPLVLMHGKKVSVGKNRVSCQSVMMLTANDAMRNIGDTISEQMPQWRDNPMVRSKLIGNLKP